MAILPSPKILPVGPCIVYCSLFKRPPMVKFVYCMPVFRKGAYKLVIEYTSVNQLPCLKGLNAHYHVMTEYDYKIAKASL